MADDNVMQSSPNNLEMSGALISRRGGFCGGGELQTPSHHTEQQAKPGIWAKASGILSASQFPGHIGFTGWVEWLALELLKFRG